MATYRIEVIAKNDSTTHGRYVGGEPFHPLEKKAVVMEFSPPERMKPRDVKAVIVSALARSGLSVWRWESLWELKPGDSNEPGGWSKIDVAPAGHIAKNPAPVIRTN